MPLKKLAYLNVKVTKSCDEFCEQYTFVKPTVLYLPHNMILKIESIEKNRICLILLNQNNPEFCKKITLTLCDCSIKVVIPSCCCEKIIICLKLDEINLLKPCYNSCSSDYCDDECYDPCSCNCKNNRLNCCD
ncbi:MAG: hypothetical protein RR359_04100 [Bacilli bacterium]